jgi:ureidoacrylate peracid hydrolase
MAHDPYWDLVYEAPEPSYDPQRTAFVIIDLQYLDAHPDGWMGRLCRDQGKPDHLKERFDFIQEILPNVKRVQVACRANGIQVIHVRIGARRYYSRDGSRELRMRQNETPLIPLDAEILDEIAPEGDDIIIDKTSVSAFNSTPVDQILRNLNVNRLWVAGVVTEGCVELFARDALDRGYHVALLTDCCASSTHDSHYNAIERMGDGGQIKMHTSAEMVALTEAAPVAAAA